MTSDSVSLDPFQSSHAERKELVQYVNAVYNLARQWPLDRNSVDLARPRAILPDESLETAASCTVRPISSQEMDTLTSVCQCTLDSRANIFLMYFRPENHDTLLSDPSDHDDLSLYLQKQYYQCSLAGTIVLGVSLHDSQDNDDDEELPYGVKFNTRIVESILEPNCKVYHNTIIAHTFIGCRASLVHCGSIRWKNNETRPLDSIHITVGPETGGGRTIHLQAEATMIDVVQSLNKPQTPTVENTYTLSLEPCCTARLNIICGSISHLDSGINIYSAPRSILQSCPSVSNTLLFSHASITHGCVVESALLQWNATITNHSTVSSTILMEHSHIGPHSLVQSSILGPDTHVSCGEVHCSIIGPNTNAHHQSLIISTLWPMGRGNVAYGCNIGSNHTGRLPDQEMMSGEGIFFGLGSSLKFPVDLTHSPYSIIAAGVTLPPQKIAIPFSLIVSHDSSTTPNEIIPGWVIHYSPYTIVRNDFKFQSRRKATRHGFYTGWQIVRPSTIHQCCQTRQALKALLLDPSGIYTGNSYPALGRNVMTEKGKNIGIQAYTTLIQRYALHGLLQYASWNMSQDPSGQSLRAFMSDMIHPQKRHWILERDKYDIEALTDDPSIRFQITSHSNDLSSHYGLFILTKEYPLLSKDMDIHGKEDEFRILKILLEKLIHLEKQWVWRIQESKRRDDIRGKDIIPDYCEYHVLTDDDAVVQLACKNLKDVEEAVTRFITQLYHES